MNINLPVTSHKLALKADSSIVSKTAAKGMIAYVNRDFIDVSALPQEFYAT